MVREVFRTHSGNLNWVLPTRYLTDFIIENLKRISNLKFQNIFARKI